MGGGIEGRSGAGTAPAAFGRRAVGHWRAAAAVGFAAIAAACDTGPLEPILCLDPSVVELSLATRAIGPSDFLRSPFDREFEAAGRESGVPPALLAAIGWVETRWQMVEGSQTPGGRPPAFGVLALRGVRLERAAALAGVSPQAAREDPLANIRAGAALLSAYADESGIDRTQPEAWGGVVARFSGIDLEEGRTAYLRSVDRALRLEHAGPERDPRRWPGLPPFCPEPPAGPSGGDAPDYAPAVWRPSPNFDARLNDRTGDVHMIVIHTCEGAYVGCWSWLRNPVSRVSAHYVIDEDGAEISQLVREADRAWHIAALYDCDLNRDHDCWLDDVQSNHFTIGIEHAGFASQDGFPASQLEASARLVCDISRDRGVPRDWRHVVAHGRLQPETRTDPGPRWPWVSYLHRVQRHCGEIVVDDDNAFNDPAVAAVEVPAGWASTDATPDFYADGYRWASTLAQATDEVVFSFNLEDAGVHTLDVRWTSGANRSPRATYVVIDARGDTLATVRMDQTAGGGRWHALGTWTFPAGWTRVTLPRRDPAGGVVVADAVRARGE